jgi:hypothetical protein
MIREGEFQDYYAFWDGGASKNGAGEMLLSDPVGFTISVEALNFEEAFAEARKRYPKATVCERFSSKMG